MLYPCMLYITALSVLLGVSQDKVNKEIENDPDEYDFIIVGAGSAGCVVANRLTENNQWTSLLLEAGTEEPLATERPGLTTSLQNTYLDWNYHTEQSEYSCLSEGGCTWNRGKGMGGTSILNFLLYIRGNREDYNNWARMGNTGWSYNDVLNYFKKSEDNRDQDILRENPGYHSSGGYLSIERYSQNDPNIDIILQGLEELGHNSTDVNGETQLGSMRLQTTSRNGSRMSANRAFIHPIRQSRKNLFIKTQVYVTKILINPETMKAFGVEYTSIMTGETIRKLARKEVIVSAGTVESPKLLMLSGIGPRDELEKHGINVIKNLSVGHNLHDHVSILNIMCNVGEKAVNPDCKKKMKDLRDFDIHRTGPLAATGVSSACAFLQTQHEESETQPDLELLFLGANSISVYYDKFIILPSLMVPKSRGYLKLNDTDPVWGQPRINPRYLSEDEDVKRMHSGIRKTLRLFNTTVFRSNNFTMDKTVSPNCSQFVFDSDEYWYCVIRQNTLPQYHPVGTCKMGPEEDTEAVVDPRLRVYGIKGLRVIDASIIPKIPRGNTHAPTVMIAEKGTDMIKQDWS